MGFHNIEFIMKHLTLSLLIIQVCSGQKLAINLFRIKESCFSLYVRRQVREKGNAVLLLS